MRVTMMTAGIAICLAAAPSAAIEYFPLSQHRDWKVGVDSGYERNVVRRHRLRPPRGLPANSLRRRKDAPLHGARQRLQWTILGGRVRRHRLRAMDAGECRVHRQRPPLGSRDRPHPTKTAEFLEDLARSGAVAFKDKDGRTDLAVWSLRGSNAAISNLLECRRRLA
jgi:hypothetical protein